MKANRLLLCVLGVAAAAALCGCGSSGGGSNPTNATSVGVSMTVARLYDAVRRADVEGVRATLAPEYAFNGIDAATAAAAFALSFQYRSLTYRIDSLTTVEDTATAIVSQHFETSLDLTSIGQGQPQVNGEARLVYELKLQSGEWRITAVRGLHDTFFNPQFTGGLAAPAFTEVTVNGQTSVRVPPGAPLTLAGKLTGAQVVRGGIVFSVGVVRVASGIETPWVVELVAPSQPGRYTVEALASIAIQNSPAEPIFFGTASRVYLPVTVVAP